MLVAARGAAVMHACPSARRFGIVSLAILARCTIAASTRADSEPTWLHDLAAGQQAAADSGKDLLILFTGRGWCQPCEIFHHEVVETDAFLGDARQHFVLIEYDSNFDDTPEGQAREAVHRRLQKQFLVPAVPTVVLAGPDAVPYAVLGYDQGEGPRKFLDRIHAAQAACDERDKNFRLAAQATGALKVELLHAGVQAVAHLFGTIDERGDDPAVVYYRPQIDAILASQATDAEAIQRRYRAQLAARDAWLEARAALTKLNEFTAARDYQGGVAFLDEVIPRTSNAEVQWQLERSRNTLLEWDHQNEAALSNVRRLLQRQDLSESQLYWLYDREIHNLFNTQRIPEAVVYLDRRIAAPADNPQRKLAWMETKAEYLTSFRQTPEAIEAWKHCIDEAPPDSFEWLSDHAFLARVYQVRAGDHRNALHHFDIVLDAIDRANRGEIELTWPWTVNSDASIALEAAQSHLALGDVAAAKAMIERCESKLPKLAESTRPSDREHATELAEQARELRAKLSANSAQNDPASTSK